MSEGLWKQNERGKAQKPAGRMAGSTVGLLRRQRSAASCVGRLAGRIAFKEKWRLSLQLSRRLASKLGTANIPAPRMLSNWPADGVVGLLDRRRYSLYVLTGGKKDPKQAVALARPALHSD